VSLRSDSQPFFHWVKADLQAFDYVYAKFNTKLDPITYTNEEYESLLKVPTWTRSETDQLMNTCHEYNMRWPVIADRFEATCHRSTEDLMARYYFIATKLKTHRAEKRGVNFSNQVVPASTFDLEYERCRRKQQDRLLRMTEVEQAEEAALREELKTLDANIKKIKKTLKQAVPPPVQAPAGTKAPPATSSKKKATVHSSIDCGSSGWWQCRCGCVTQNTASYSHVWWRHGSRAWSAMPAECPAGILQRRT
jgi:DNA methyltransferase 1-associated protein 1